AVLSKTAVAVSIAAPASYTSTTYPSAAGIAGSSQLIIAVVCVIPVIVRLVTSLQPSVVNLIVAVAIRLNPQSASRYTSYAVSGSNPVTSTVVVPAAIVSEKAGVSCPLTSPSTYTSTT